MVVDYDKGCIVLTLEDGKCVTIHLNGVEFTTVSFRLREPEYDISTLGKKLKKFHDDLLHNMPRDNMVPWLKEFIESPRFDDGKDHTQVVSKLLTDVRKKLKAQLGEDVALALLPKSNRRITYPLEKISFEGMEQYSFQQYSFPEISILEGTPGMVLSKDGTEIELIPECIKGKLIIPEGVIKLEGDIFERCGKITDIRIPSSLTFIANSFNWEGIDIHQNIFSKCYGLKNIEVSKDNPVYKSVRGMLFNKKGTKLIFVPRGIKGKLCIPEGVTEIGEYAFEHCTGLTSITMPETVTKIGEYAFYGCVGLTSITIPGRVKMIGSAAFACTGLVRIEVAEENLVYKSTRGMLLNKEGTKLIFIPEGLKEELCIPEGVTEIGRNAFVRPVKSITIPASVREIDEMTFWGFTELTSITISEGVTKIGANAFQGCTGLKSITIPESVTKIGDCAFYGCVGLTSITISKGVTKIGSSAFGDCTGLKRITISEGVTEIGHEAFKGCTGLTRITIPKSITEIEWDVFAGCTGLKSVKVLKENPAYMSINGMLFNKEGTRIIFVPEGVKGILKVPKGVIEIGQMEFGDGAFERCSGLVSIIIPVSVKKIGQRTFAGCTGLTSITIPEGVTEIGDSAFDGCIGLKSITIPKSVTVIGRYSFNGCTGLTNIKLSKSVIKIKEHTFQGCTGLESITIPKSVTKIVDGAFYNCMTLKEIHFDGDVPSLGVDAFENVHATVYYRKGTKGWGKTFGGLPTKEMP